MQNDIQLSLLGALAEQELAELQRYDGDAAWGDIGLGANLDAGAEFWIAEQLAFGVVLRGQVSTTGGSSRGERAQRALASQRSAGIRARRRAGGFTPERQPGPSHLLESPLRSNRLRRASPFRLGHDPARPSTARMRATAPAISSSRIC